MDTAKMIATGSTLLNPDGVSDLVNRAAKRSRAGSIRVPARNTQALSKSPVSGTPQYLRVAIKVQGAIYFINLDEIVSIQASGNYVALDQGASTHLLRDSFWRVAEMFESCGFIRIHRSVLVNTSFVVQIRPRATGGYVLRVAGGKEYQVTRMYKKNLKSLTDYWVGTGTLFID